MIKNRYRKICNYRLQKKNAKIKNRQVVLFIQFDNEEPIEAIKCNGKNFKLVMKPINETYVLFQNVDKTKSFKMICKNL